MKPDVECKCGSRDLEQLDPYMTPNKKLFQQFRCRKCGFTFPIDAKLTLIPVKMPEGESIETRTE